MSKVNIGERLAQIFINRRQRKDARVSMSNTYLEGLILILKNEFNVCEILQGLENLGVALNSDGVRKCVIRLLNFEVKVSQLIPYQNWNFKRICLKFHINPLTVHPMYRRWIQRCFARAA